MPRNCTAFRPRSRRPRLLQVGGLGHARRAPRAPDVEHDDLAAGRGHRPARPGQRGAARGPAPGPGRPARAARSTRRRTGSSSGRPSGPARRSSCCPSRTPPDRRPAPRRPRRRGVRLTRPPSCWRRAAARPRARCSRSSAARRRRRSGWSATRASTAACAGRATAGVPSSWRRAIQTGSWWETRTASWPRAAARASAIAAQHAGRDLLVRLAPGRAERVDQLRPVLRGGAGSRRRRRTSCPRSSCPPR